MFDLFNPAPDNFKSMTDLKKQPIVNDVSDIIGLKYIPNFIDEIQVKQFIASINNEQWLNDLKRRVQHYGYKYD